MNVQELDSLEDNGLNRQVAKTPVGGFVERDGEAFYVIEDVDGMPPFLVNLVSGSDHWMFVASNGAVTAGRRDPDNALFPYVTQDKLFDSTGTTGSLTLAWVEGPGGSFLWQPFVDTSSRAGVARRLYKNALGTKIVFEEELVERKLVFRYQWSFSSEFGVVRRASLENRAAGNVSVRLLDGLRNLLPYGLDQAFVNQFSNLADAYKKSELLAEECLGVYYLSSIPTDRAEPSEGLKATVVWSPEKEADAVLLSPDQIARFKRGEDVDTEVDRRGRRCCYLLEKRMKLAAGEARNWHIVADINQDATAIEALRVKIESGRDMAAAVLQEVEANSAALRLKIAAADGLQSSAHQMRDVRHQSNALFNIMRGGVFNDGYRIDVADFLKYLRAANRDIAERVEKEALSWGAVISRPRLVQWADESGDANLARLTREYLPLTFSRRHGDPSRPWNRFSIETQDENGDPVLAYQGNWRDIFQNWEPLGYSFPEYLEGMIGRFLNASTADGYNPYRLSRVGFDWETIEPDEPWSNIGYWGDHQIVYLLKLLEAQEDFYPGEIAGQLSERRFVYAHVPYRILGFEEILKNPRASVVYDEEAAVVLEARSERMGEDGKLLQGGKGKPATASLLEKLLVPLLAKLSNFVPGGGIWMTTQRPEWNDANNALVGYGVSVVTLCYTHRYIAFLIEQLESSEAAESYVFERLIADQLAEQASCFAAARSGLENGFDGRGRFALMEALGSGATKYRDELYRIGLSGAVREVSRSSVIAYLKEALVFVADSIDGNAREEGLYHSYNLLKLDLGERTAEVERLPVMLEGQVAALSSGRIGGAASLRLLGALRTSALYRADVDSYMLYPDRELPRFLEKNVIAVDGVEGSSVLKAMLERGDGRVVKRDAKGNYRFDGRFRNSGDLRSSLESIQEEGTYGDIRGEIVACEKLFEDSFDHRRFLGRSGTFFAYEGLGSIYWHMVSKLILAIQEQAIAEYARAGASDAFEDLKLAYRQTLAGLGLDKTPGQYGAFPLDAYSHTPRHAGAQQPGMTGQVKEDLLTRWAELGLRFDGGCIRFSPELLDKSAFLGESRLFEYIDAEGAARSLELQKGQLAFTFCQVPFVVERSGSGGSLVLDAAGVEEKQSGWTLGMEQSREIFKRSGSVAKVTFTMA